MAWINNKWIEGTEREELINSTRNLIKAMTSQIDILTPSELEELDSYINDIERLERIHRCEVDLLYFCWEYFSELRNPGNNGNWDGFDIESPAYAADFHKEICSTIDHVSNKEKNAKIANAASRGHAKSSYLAKGNPLREVVFRKRKFVVVISETPKVATSILEWIGWQLKTNRKLREDFGELLSHKQQLNPKDNQVEFITWENKGENEPKKLLSYFISASTNQAIRGLNWNGVRPDYIVLDDLEGIHSNAGTPEQRVKLQEWFASDIVPLGDPKGEKTAFIYMGTIVHQDSLLNKVINDNPDFKTKKYKAIIEPPERLDLWEECRSIYLDKNLSKEERKNRAIQFYEENKSEMDKGVKVLWEEFQPIFKLMKWKWDYGSKAFNTEYQNEPRDEENAVFVPDEFTTYTHDEFEEIKNKVDYYSFWDVATGKNIKRTDYNAIVTVAKNRISGAIYIVDAWGAKCKLDKAMDKAVEVIKKYSPKVFGVESIGVSWDTPRQLKQQLDKQGISNTRVKPVNSHEIKKKDDRIASMQPLIEKGFLLFTGNEALLNEQMEQFPGGSNDDLPDALASVIEIAGGIKRRNRTFRNKPKGW